MKIECACGHRMSDGTDGLSYEAHFVPDEDWERLWLEIDSAIENSGPGAREKEAACMRLRSLRIFRDIWQCPSCGRLYVEDQSHALRSFVAESEEVPKCLLSRRQR